MKTLSGKIGLLALVLAFFVGGINHASALSDREARGQVLGQTSYETQTIFKQSNLTLQVTPYDFDEGSQKWNYKVSWNRPGKRAGSIYINGNVFVADASGRGEAFTGFSLSPQTNYRIVFYSLSNGGGVRVVNRTFTTLPAETTIEDREDNSGATSDSPRAGSLIVKPEGTVFLVGSAGLYAFPNVATFTSWGYSFTQVVPANSAELAMSQMGIVPERIPGCPTPLDQLNGRCDRTGSLVVTPLYLNFNANSGVMSQNLSLSGLSGQWIANVSTTGGNWLRLNGSTTGATGVIGSTAITVSVDPGSASSLTGSVAGSITFSSYDTPSRFASVTVPVTLTLASGTGRVLNVSVDASSPVQGSTVKAGAVSAPILVTKLTATGGNVSLSKFQMSLPSAILTNPKIYLDGNDVTVQAVAVSAAAGTTNYWISLSPTVVVPQNQSRLFVLKADVSTSAVGQYFTVGFDGIVFEGTGVNVPQLVGLPFSSNSLKVTTETASIIRVGQLINNNGTVFYVGPTGVYGIPSMAVFNSWNWSFTQVLPANSAELALNQVGVIPMRLPECTNPMDQIAGKCGVISGGNLIASLDFSSPVTSLTVGNQTRTVAAYKFTSSSDTSTITELNFNLAGYTTVSSAVLKDGGTLVGNVAGSGGSFNFQGLNIVVPANSSKILTLDLVLGQINSMTGQSGENVRPTLTSYKFASSSTGVLSTKNVSLPANNTYVYKAVPVITNVSLPTQNLVSGTNTLAKFNISSGGVNAVSWTRVTFNVNPSSGVSLSSYSLWDADSGVKLIGDFTQNGSKVFFGALDEQLVNGSKTYMLKATVGGQLTNGSYVNTSIPQSPANDYAKPTSNFLVSNSPATFVWSDVSFSGHNLNSEDWNSDYLVKNLPTDSQTLYGNATNPNVEPSLSVGLDASSPLSAMVSSPQTKIVASYQFSAQNADLSIKELVFNVEGAKLISSISLKDGSGGSLLGTVVGGTPQASLSGLNITIPANSKKTLVLEANFLSPDPPSGLAIKFSVAKASYVSVASGVMYSYTGPSAYSNPMYLFRAIPTITNVSLPTGTLAEGNNTIAKFIISSTGSGPVAWTKIVFNYSASPEITLSSPTLWDADSNVLLNGLATVDGQKIVFTTNIEQVALGAKTYVLKAIVNSSGRRGSTEYVTTSIPQLSTSMSGWPNNDAGAKAAATSFVWSDYSSFGHSLWSQDWFGDYMVKNLPTDSQTLVR